MKCALMGDGQSATAAAAQSTDSRRFSPRHASAAAVASTTFGAHSTAAPFSLSESMAPRETSESAQTPAKGRVVYTCNLKRTTKESPPPFIVVTDETVSFPCLSSPAQDLERGKTTAPAMQSTAGGSHPRHDASSVSILASLLEKEQKRKNKLGLRGLENVNISGTQQQQQQQHHRHFSTASFSSASFDLSRTNSAVGAKIEVRVTIPIPPSVSRLPFSIGVGPDGSLSDHSANVTHARCSKSRECGDDSGGEVPQSQLSQKGGSKSPAPTPQKKRGNYNNNNNNNNNNTSGPLSSTSPAPGGGGATPRSAAASATAVHVVVDAIDDRVMSACISASSSSSVGGGGGGGGVGGQMPTSLRLKVGDTLVRINGARPKGLADASERLQRLLAAHRTIDLDVLRAPTALRVPTTTIALRKNQQQQKQPAERRRQQFSIEDSVFIGNDDGGDDAADEDDDNNNDEHYLGRHSLSLNDNARGGSVENGTASGKSIYQQQQQPQHCGNDVICPSAAFRPTAPLAPFVESAPICSDATADTPPQTAMTEYRGVKVEGEGEAAGMMMVSELDLGVSPISRRLSERGTSEKREEEPAEGVATMVGEAGMVGNETLCAFSAGDMATTATAILSSPDPRATARGEDNSKRINHIPLTPTTISVPESAISKSAETKNEKVFEAVPPFVYGRLDKGTAAKRRRSSSLGHKDAEETAAAAARNTPTSLPPQTPATAVPANANEQGKALAKPSFAADLLAAVLQQRSNCKEKEGGDKKCQAARSSLTVRSGTYSANDTPLFLEDPFLRAVVAGGATPLPSCSTKSIAAVAGRLDSLMDNLASPHHFTEEGHRREVEAARARRAASRLARSGGGLSTIGGMDVGILGGAPPTVPAIVTPDESSSSCSASDVDGEGGGIGGRFGSAHVYASHRSHRRNSRKEPPVGVSSADVLGWCLSLHQRKKTREGGVASSPSNAFSPSNAPPPPPTLWPHTQADNLSHMTMAYHTNSNGNPSSALQSQSAGWPFSSHVGCDAEFHRLMRSLFDSTRNENTISPIPIPTRDGIAAIIRKAADDAAANEERFRKDVRAAAEAEVGPLRPNSPTKAAGGGADGSSSLMPSANPLSTPTTATASTAPAIVVPRGRLQKEMAAKEQAAKLKRQQQRADEREASIRALVAARLRERDDEAKALAAAARKLNDLCSVPTDEIARLFFGIFVGPNHCSVASNENRSDNVDVYGHSSVCGSDLQERLFGRPNAAASISDGTDEEDCSDGNDYDDDSMSRDGDGGGKKHRRRHRSRGNASAASSDDADEAVSDIATADDEAEEKEVRMMPRKKRSPHQRPAESSLMNNKNSTKRVASKRGRTDTIPPHIDLEAMYEAATAAIKAEREAGAAAAQKKRIAVIGSASHHSTSSAAAARDEKEEEGVKNETTCKAPLRDCDQRPEHHRPPTDNHDSSSHDVEHVHGHYTASASNVPRPQQQQDPHLSQQQQQRPSVLLDETLAAKRRAAAEMLRRIREEKEEEEGKPRIRGEAEGNGAMGGNEHANSDEVFGEGGDMQPMVNPFAAGFRLPTAHKKLQQPPHPHVPPNRKERRRLKFMGAFRDDDEDEGKDEDGFGESEGAINDTAARHQPDAHTNAHYSHLHASSTVHERASSSRIVRESPKESPPFVPATPPSSSVSLTPALGPAITSATATYVVAPARQSTVGNDNVPPPPAPYLPPPPPPLLPLAATPASASAPVNRRAQPQPPPPPPPTSAPPIDSVITEAHRAMLSRQRALIAELRRERMAAAEGTSSVTSDPLTAAAVGGGGRSSPQNATTENGATASVAFSSPVDGPAAAGRSPTTLPSPSPAPVPSAAAIPAMQVSPTTASGVFGNSGLIQNNNSGLAVDDASAAAAATIAGQQLVHQYHLHAQQQQLAQMQQQQQQQMAAAAAAAEQQRALLISHQQQQQYHQAAQQQQLAAASGLYGAVSPQYPQLQQQQPPLYAVAGTDMSGYGYPIAPPAASSPFQQQQQQQQQQQFYYYPAQPFGGAF